MHYFGHDIRLSMPYTSDCCWFSFLTESGLIVPETMWLAPVSLNKIKCNAHAMSVNRGAFSMTSSRCERIRPDSIPTQDSGGDECSPDQGGSSSFHFAPPCWAWWLRRPAVGTTTIRPSIRQRYPRTSCQSSAFSSKSVLRGAFVFGAETGSDTDTESGSSLMSQPAHEVKVCLSSCHGLNLQS